MLPGIMPILHSPGVITPGQLGPTNLTPWRFTQLTALTISWTGTPSVMATISGILTAAASIIASAANGGGTKIMDAFAPVASTACFTVLKIGTPSKSCPPLPGVTPLTMLVP